MFSSPFFPPHLNFLFHFFASRFEYIKNNNGSIFFDPQVNKSQKKSIDFVPCLVPWRPFLKTDMSSLVSP